MMKLCRAILHGDSNYSILATCLLLSPVLMTVSQESLEVGCMTTSCALCRRANTATAEMAVLKWLLLCLLLSAGPKLAAARGLLEAVPGNFFSARALLQAEQCTCTCPSPTTGSAPALAPQLTGAAAPGLAPETGSPPAPAPAPLPENTSALAPAPEMGSPPAEAPGPDMGNSTVPSTVPAPAPESESPGASAPALVPGSSISETPVPIISGSPRWLVHSILAVTLFQTKRAYAHYAMCHLGHHRPISTNELLNHLAASIRIN